MAFRPYLTIGLAFSNYAAYNNYSTKKSNKTTNYNKFGMISKNEMENHGSLHTL